MTVHETRRFELSPEGKLLDQRLSKLAPGEEVSYADLLRLTKLPDRSTLVAYARRSCKRTQEREGAVIVADGHMQVYRRLTDEEIATKRATKHARAVRRAADRGSRELDCVQDLGQLSAAAKSSLIGSRVVLEIAKRTASPANVRAAGLAASEEAAKRQVANANSALEEVLKRRE